ncbi:MAG TPA: enoyl-CoA hydratase/isomerase family protein [Pseudonocardia sp.]|jgi:enoyl-CoA hydratase
MTEEANGQDDALLLTRDRGLGHIVLNRPKAINALTHDMAVRMNRVLGEWADDPAVSAVLITGAGERGLCAGGDIRAIYFDAKEGGTETLDFWRDEYHLNARIADYPKPVVAVLHGLVMGGGIGVSAHAGQRIVTEGSKLGMPEVGIGLVPDVGGSWLLARSPGELGTHVALSTTQFGPADAIEMGFADWYLPAEALSGLAEALAAVPLGPDAAEAVRLVIESRAEQPPASTLAEQREWIDTCYQGDSVEDIVARLAASGEPDAERAAKEIGRKSPSCLKVALAALRRARALSLHECLNQELRVSTHCFQAPDLAEGIRAQVIDKDRDPKWSPSVLEQVTEEHVEHYFAALGERELGLA